MPVITPLKFSKECAEDKTVSISDFKHFTNSASKTKMVVFVDFVITLRIKFTVISLLSPIIHAQLIFIEIRYTVGLSILMFHLF